MMQDEPTPAELLEGVATMLRDFAMPELTGRTAFLVRVGANAVDLVRRQIELGEKFDAAEHARLVALLKSDGSLPDLNARLCEAIEQRRITLDTPGLADHLWATTMEKLAVDQPQYASYRRALKHSNPTP
jgi:hypothetical protein